MGLRDAIANSARNKNLALLPFLPAGYPDTPTFIHTLRALPAAGADAVEIGFPFSDPIADGPTIQAAFAETLSRGFKTSELFCAVRQARASVDIPLIAMVSHSIVFRHGASQFFATCRDAGFDAVIIPDLPPPEAQPTCELIRQARLDTVLLVAPTTAPQRRREIAALCSGFVYYLSVSGITGERNELPPDIAGNLSDLRSATDVPICVGFGISKPAHLRQLAGKADGAIVGTAVVRKIRDLAGNPPETIAAGVAEYCRQLLSEVR